MVYKSIPALHRKPIKSRFERCDFLLQKGLILIRPFLLAFNCTVIIGQTLWFSKANVVILGGCLTLLML